MPMKGCVRRALKAAPGTTITGRPFYKAFGGQFIACRIKIIKRQSDSNHEYSAAQP